MKIDELISKFGLEKFTEPADGGLEVAGGYVSDLLSDVIANGEKDVVWVTMQTHVNIVAVAALKELAAIVIAGGRKPDAETMKQAQGKGVCLLGSAKTAFDTAGELHAAGLRGASA